ncbi:hypothetical protein A2331_03395 [Candidatus Falkowbacteria bacterium RIFOXYB2_FULL_34_18]|uniref:DUF3795 domain-containing protein n=1 Tax=Candidatus Falkowbacteria bacterium RIFOXYD2_FULL_34_120 TaxID=1798007 RepID=A0A1F5TP18_9BACT|nr:MAG: hypothetical protein A2331_03395 [Candidatus Falkowbacteria bacterium RIFOXYB2_FULL_34_18]OGF28935.1 MAG: hypothetical protein A2500_01665 [Candidatus Falkowbacteria bacterium RIFOXYC12_FULL_34_55]OGF35866.1 MAG: hypothetical protein A2466_03715 [Candidatus Falkowbacteria bacterium RIFOXYC2_FULL_34_220]OGF38473.1 MAG: hypothetical protein A2515_07085 [Candidatus Falkowbacteria bacterium RIFOXYD12_FULL_34_57]OGF40539.1 MAG: hypothetical protein A2531_04500 [Candidatus Falkowbacteria bact
MQKDNHLVGCCGISCFACGLYVKNKCEGCTKTQEAVDSLNKEGIGCSVLECAVKKEVDVCSRDCQDFPCDKFEGWPLSQEWLDMYKSRNK